MHPDDLTEVHKIDHDPEPAISLFLNRSIDWNDDRAGKARASIDLTILTIGSSLNLIILFAIVTIKRMHVPIGCYIVSLTISNFVIILNVADDVILHLFDYDFQPDVDFVSRVTLHSSALTLVIFSLDRYIILCRVATMWQKTASEFSTGVIVILIIWSFAVITTAMELNLYEHLRLSTVVNIFCWSTGLYLLFPTFLIVFLNIFIVLEIAESRGIASIWTDKDLASLRLLACLLLNFYVTMVPQRFATILWYEAPEICCTSMTMIVCYYIPKVSTIIGPLICLGNLKPFQHWAQVKINLLV